MISRMLIAVVLATSAAGACTKPPEPPPEKRAAITSRAPGQLDLEEGLVSVRPDNWYQDKFGLARADGDRNNKLELTNQWETADTLLVHIHSTLQSGTDLAVRFQFKNDHITQCLVEGRWRADFGSSNNPTGGKIEVQGGLAHVDLRGDDLGCLFVVRGNLWRKSEEGEPPDIVLGGFEIHLPPRDK